VSRLSGIRTDLEVAWGGVQLRAMQRAVAIAAGVKLHRDGGLEYLTRPGKRGVPLVGIHGFGGDKETWLLMSAMIPRARGLALVDLPGHGGSDDVDEARASIRDHAEAVLRVMDRERIERAILCGNSMGGGVALRLAASWPDRVAGLVLVASIGRGVHAGAALAWLDGDNPLIPRPEDIEQFMKLALERPPPVGKAVIRHVVTERARRADALRRLFRGFVLAGGDDGVPQQLGLIAQPTLVIHGEQDRVIDVRTAEDLAHNIPGATLTVMRGVGHAPQLEAPRHTAKLVEAFARKVDTAVL
jgi:pimeloyl-ACP methyl ester carboxylesterase